MMLTLSAVVVTLTFQSDPRLSQVIQTAAVVEAAAIWAPYGVDVRSAAPCGLFDDSTSLTVAIEDEVVRPGPDARYTGTFGAIRFTNGVPAPAIVVFYDAMIRLTDTALLRDTPLIAWPNAFRTFILGRVIGRVLAHEIGHFLLQLHGHSAGGLMRAQPSVAELVDANRGRFALSAADQARWARVRDGGGASTAASATRADTVRRPEPPAPRRD